MWLLLALSGCGGQTGGQPLSYADAAAVLFADLAQINVSSPAALPTVGQASYTGFSTINLPDGAQMIHYTGLMNVTVDFDVTAPAITGRITQIEGMTGELQSSNAQMSWDHDPDHEHAIWGGLEGELFVGASLFAIDGDFAADFHGRHQDALLGVIYGTVLGPNGTESFDGTMGGTQSD